MTTKILVRQGGGSATEVDFANAFTARKGAPFFDQNTPLVRMGQQWSDGAAAGGEFRVVDPNGVESTSGFKILPWAEVRLTEDASGDELTLAWMRFTSRDVERRGVYIGGDDVEHLPQLSDCNIDLRGIPFRSAWERPAETDIERLEALFERKLSGSASTAPNLFRITTDITFDSFANGHLAEHNTPVDMEAWTYPEGTEVNDVIAHIAEEAGKQWGVVLHDTAGSTHKCLLYVDTEDLDRWQTAVRISDDLADYDPDDETAPTFEPHWMQGAGRESDFMETYSGVINIYGGTNDDPRTVYVETGAAPEDAETWVAVRNDDETRTEGGATRHATTYLNKHKNPYQSNKVSILVKAAQAHLVRAGQAIEIKSVVVNTGADKETFKWRRVAQVIVEPAADELYWLHLNLERPRKGRGGGGSGGGHAQPAATSPKPAPECIPVPDDVVTVLSDSTSSPLNWPGSDVTTGSCWGGDHHMSMGASGGSSSQVVVSAGDIIRGAVEFREETGNDSWENVDNYNYQAYLEFERAAPGLPIISHQIVDQRYHNVGCINVTHSTTETVPTGYDRARVKIGNRLGGVRYIGTISEVDPADVPDNDEFCIPPGSGGESPFFARSDDPRFDNDDQHLTTALKGRVVNNSGATLNAGDVVIADPSYTDGAAVTTTTDAAQTAQRVGVMTEGVAADAVGVVLWEGLVRFPVNGASGAADLDYLYTSAVAGEADTDATRSAGAVGQIIFDDASSPYIQWWGVPDTSTAGEEAVVDHGDLTGLGDDDHPQYLRTDGGEKHTINVVAAAGATETLSLASGNVHDVTLTADCTVTLAGATNGVGCYMYVLLRQGSGAPWEVTWPGSVEWIGGAAPVLEMDEDAWNWVTLFTMDGGTVWFGDGGGGGMASLSDDTPLAISGAGDPGISTDASRSDHVHPSTGAVGALLIADDATSPIDFADILQPDEGIGLLYTDV
jgi:hypothetical protein